MIEKEKKTAFVTKHLQMIRFSFLCLSQCNFKCKFNSFSKAFIYKFIINFRLHIFRTYLFLYLISVFFFSFILTFLVFILISFLVDDFFFFSQFQLEVNRRYALLFCRVFWPQNVDKIQIAC